MSKNHFRGMLSLIAVAEDAGLVLERDRVPESAASRLKGRDEELCREGEKEGGSIRVNGAETRRFLRSKAFLDLGERPAGAVKGARGEEMFALARWLGV